MFLNRNRVQLGTKRKCRFYLDIELSVSLWCTRDAPSQVIKSKSEISALTDFLSWIEAVKENADGVILVYHEPRKVIPAMLLESLKKYDLVDRFKQTVKGFANGFNIAEEKCANSAHIYSLRTLSRTLLKKVKRAILHTYESKDPKRDDLSLIRIRVTPR
jgi:hypothetical protein